MTEARREHCFFCRSTDSPDFAEKSRRKILCVSLSAIFLFTAFRKGLKKIKRSFLLLYPFAFLLFFP